VEFVLLHEEHILLVVSAITLYLSAHLKPPSFLIRVLTYAVLESIGIGPGASSRGWPPLVLPVT
jgi:hypothetical protein